MQRVQQLDEGGEEGSDLEQGTLWDKWVADFWQDKALQIFQCPDRGVVAVNVTQGHGGSPDSRVSKLFNTWLCKLGNAVAACAMLLLAS